MCVKHIKTSQDAGDQQLNSLETIYFFAVFLLNPAGNMLSLPL